MKSSTVSTIDESSQLKCPEVIDVPNSATKSKESPPKTPLKLDIEGLDLADVSDVIGSPLWTHINNASQNKDFDFHTIKYWTRAAANAATTAKDLGASPAICKSVAVAVLNVSESLTPKDKECARKLRPYLAMAAEAASRAVVFNGGSQYIGAAVSASVLMSLNEVLSLSVREDDDDSSVDYSIYSSGGQTAKDFDVEIAYEEDEEEDLIELHRAKPKQIIPENDIIEEEEEDINDNLKELEQDDMKDEGRLLYSATTFEADAEQQDDWSLEENQKIVGKSKKKSKKKILYRLKRCFSKSKKNEEFSWL